jgi:ribosomal protein S18 acetylase RimI-like enzyme
MLDPSARARAWRQTALETVCDVIEPWAHGRVLRATRYPSYYEYNIVCVEDEPEMSAAELAAFADQALAGLAHRRLDFESVAAGEARRGALVQRGWLPTRLLWMRHEPPVAPIAQPPVELEEVPYDDVLDLRLLWHREDFAEHTGPQELEHYRSAGRQVALSRGASVFAVRGDSGDPIAFAQLERQGTEAEISQVYVHPHHRGRGLGGAVTQGAIRAASGVHDLWIVADDEDRAKDLYARLGFRPVCASIEFLLLV